MFADWLGFLTIQSNHYKNKIKTFSYYMIVLWIKMIDQINGLFLFFYAFINQSSSTYFPR